MNKEQSETPKEPGVLYSSVNDQRIDEDLHADLLTSAASVADEAGIRVLMQNGLTREQACRFIGGGQGRS